MRTYTITCGGTVIRVEGEPTGIELQGWAESVEVSWPDGSSGTSASMHAESVGSKE